MTHEQQWINGAPIPLDSVIGRLILAEQTRTVIKLDHILTEMHFLPNRIAQSINGRREHRGWLKQYTDFLQALLYVMILVMAVVLWWREPELFHKVMLALAVR
jgi:hypothetical protein